MSVKVAVRVRPFNQREIDLGNDKVCVEMKGKQTILNRGDGNIRDFAFDYSFWSHDQFEMDNKGMSVGTSSKYADQQFVFDQVGKEVLDNAWQGYHCCLFAYGQTGAGKSYSMVGYGANRGIVPIACDEIFKRIAENTNPNKSYEVDLAMLEIYNEKIQDLMIETNKRPTSGLQVREHKLYGVYVEGLSKYNVASYEQIDKRMEMGTKNRTVGATQMNQNSSRAHTIIRIEFKTKELIDGRITEKLSVINLVDLAGSEKLSKTGATGDRFKEAVNINQSLTSLGLVISALAEKAMGKSNKVIPYRESQLTRILQNALGGNSKTLMICAISPSEDNYEETLSTLRYADQAKKIKCNAVVNESEQDKMIRQLKLENDNLKKMLEQLMKSGQAINIQQLGTIKTEMEENDQFIQNEQTIKQQQQIQQKEEEKVIQKDDNLPQLMNIHEDPQLNNKIKYYLETDLILIGRKNAQTKNDIEIGGLGLSQNHLKIYQTNDQVFIEAYDQNSKEYIVINGLKIQQKTELKNNDRIILGTNTYLIFKAKNQQLDSKYDWSYLQTEIIENMNVIKNMEIDKEINQYKEKLDKEKQQIQEEIDDMKQEYQQKLKQLQEQFSQQDKENQNNEDIQKKQNNLSSKELEEIQEEAEELNHEIKFMEQEQIVKMKQKDYVPHVKKELENKLGKYYKQVQEMNLIARTFHKQVELTSKIIYKIEDEEEEQQQPLYDCQLKIEVVNNEYGYIYRWDLDKFETRYYLVQDLMQEFLQSNTIPHLQKEQDPYWDPPEPELIGQTYILLTNIPYIIENPCELEIISENKQGGLLLLNTIPTDDQGLTNLAEIYDQNDEIIEQPEEMLNKPIYFNLSIDSITFPSLHNLSDLYCSYTLLDQNMQSILYKTQIFQLDGKTANINYKKLHGYSNINPQILDYLVEKQICINIYGVEKVSVDYNILSKNQSQIQSQIIKRQSVVHKMSSEVVKRRSTQLNITPLQFSQLKKAELQKSQQQEIKQSKKQGCIIF